MTLLPDPLPTGPPDVRIADADRDKVVEFLRFHCAEGRLTLDEFSDRVGDVYGARTSTELAATIADLPVATEPRSPGRGGATPAPAAATTLSRRRRAIRWTVSIMGGNQQKGRWRIDHETNVVSIMGGCQIDLRQAEVAGDEIVINAFALMGGVDIVVPEGIEVVMEAFVLMGGRNMRVADVPTLPGSPVVKVRGFACMGGVNVRSKPPKGAPSTRRNSRSAMGGDDPVAIAREAGRAARDAVRQARKAARDDVRGKRQHDGAERHRAEAGSSVGDPSLPVPPHAPPPPRAMGVEALAGTVAEQWRELRSRVAPEGTVTILFSDIEGFTTLTERLGDHRASILLKEHNDIVRAAVQQHRGFEVKNQGDGFMIAFDSASRALRCSIAIQRMLREFNDTSDGEQIAVRMGLHTGEAIRDADDFLGNTVNVAARVADEAAGGEILASGLLKELCAASGEFAFDGGDEVELRGLSQRHRLWSVRWE